MSDDVIVYHGDALDVLAGMPDGSVDAVVTDPPYNLSFMAKPWDAYEGREDAGFAYWLAGLIDGEGHFAIKRHSRGTHAPYFQLKMRADERGTLDRIKRTTGIGVVSTEDRTDGNPLVKWTVQDKEGCQRLVDLLDKYQLRAKKRLDYLTWREAVCEWTERPRGNRWHGGTDNTRMAVLRDRIMATRAYAEIPWSGHEYQDWCRLWAQECLRLLKPGGHLLAFGGPRTFHRLTCAIEDAGFEIRDCISYLFGAGFPKSLDVSKAIDRAAPRAGMFDAFASHFRERRAASGLTQKAIAQHFPSKTGGLTGCVWNWENGANVPTREQWATLAPMLGLSDEWLPLIERVEAEREIVGTKAAIPGVAFNTTGPSELDVTAPATDDARRWQGFGTSLKPAWEPIIVARKPLAGTVAANVLAHGTGALNIDGCRIAHANGADLATSKAKNPGRADLVTSDTYGADRPQQSVNDAGRWPANVVLDEDAAAQLDRQSGNSRDGVAVNRNKDAAATKPASEGGASRFYYTAKAAPDERPRVNGIAHPTVKPLDLIRWLVRLVTPPGGLVLDPFAGSGTTGEACLIEGFRCVLIEREADYLPLIRARLSKPVQPVLGVAP